jgi:hypothetical protein
MYLSAFFIYGLQIASGLLIYFFGNYYLEPKEWAIFSSYQYTALIIVSISWLGTDLSGIRIISDSSKETRGSDFVAIIFLRNLAFLLLFICLCPLILGNLSLNSFLYGLGMLNLPSFYFFGRKKRFWIYVLSEILQKISIVLLLLISVLYNFAYYDVFLVFGLIYCLHSLSLFSYVFTQEQINFNLVSRKIRKAKENYLQTGFFYIILQFTQQIIYTLPVIIFQRVGIYELAAELTNLERVVRIIRGTIGQAIKVLIGKVGDYSKEIKYLLFFITINIIFILLFTLGSESFKYFAEIFKFDFFNLGIFLSVIPLASISTFLLGTRLRQGKFFLNDFYKMLLRLGLSILSMIAVIFWFKSIAALVILIFILEIWLLFILYSVTVRQYD